MHPDPKILVEYLPVTVFFGIAAFIALVVIILPKIFAKETPQKDKLKSYECGFDPFEEDTRGKFDVRFYLVSILFIIFDIEVTYLFPWAVCLSSMDFFAFFIMIIFLLILTLGFVYEWKKGALDW